GLSICKRLLDLMGGRIDAQSELGEGSVFRFEVELSRREADANSPAAEAETSEDAQWHGERALVAHGSSACGQILGDILRRGGLDCRTVASGQAARDTVAEARRTGEPYRFVLLDARLPDIDGFALAEILKAEGALIDDLIMMLSAVDRTGDADRCRRLGIR